MADLFLGTRVQANVSVFNLVPEWVPQVLYVSFARFQFVCFIKSSLIICLFSETSLKDVTVHI